MDVYRWGMIAFASSLDQGGPMARTAADCALLLNCMASYDNKDSTCIDRDVPDYSANISAPLSGLRIGVPKEYFQRDCTRTAEAVQQALTEFENQGAQLVEISLPNTGLSVPAYYVIAPAKHQPTYRVLMALNMVTVVRIQRIFKTSIAGPAPKVLVKKSNDEFLSAPTASLLAIMTPITAKLSRCAD